MKGLIRKGVQRLGRVFGFRVVERSVPGDANGGADQLQVERRARQAGARNEPPPEATGPDANEEQVLRHFHEQRGVADQWFEAEHEPLEQALWRDRQDLDPQRLDECVNEFKHSVSGLQSSMEDQLVEARRAERRHARELRAFRDEHQLLREPRQAENLLLHFAVILALVVVEAAVNAWVFGKGAWGGWLEGLMIALIVATLNVGAAVVAGLGIREMFHLARGRRAVGIAIGVIYFGLFLYPYTLLIGHYRQALLANADQAAQQAVLRFWNSFDFPPALNELDIQTLLFIAVSAGFALVAFWAGLHLYDVYPGYSARWNAYHRARETLENLRMEFRANFWRLFQEQREAIAARRAVAQDARNRYRLHLRAIARLTDQYRHWVGEIATVCGYYLRLYRRINERVRTAPVPAYFQSEPEMPFAGANKAIDTSAWAGAERFEAGLDSLVEKLNEKAHEAEDRLGRAYDEAEAKVRSFFAHTDAIAEGDVRHDAAAHETPAPAPSMIGQREAAPPHGPHLAERPRVAA